MAGKDMVVGNEGSWYTQIGRLKRTYSSLTNMDLNFTESQKDRLIETLSIKLGVSEDSIKEVMSKRGSNL